MWLAEAVEPERAHLREHTSLVWDTAGQNPVEGADPIAGNQQQPIAEIVNVANFAPADGQISQIGLHHRLAHGESFPGCPQAS